ncbi:hypothetical protein [Ideonella paludis]|uniref:Uncharacterized protein n=1 Tax=Ideonella paludis TaxID=1233411 RepID=A0ABS5DTF7_9BURK|nr:hypothetical protein [Ideonella paludis]MBQ0934434.1 hypothetical protein [Ideonella paludis]
MKVILRPSDRSSSPWLRRQWQRVRQAVKALLHRLRAVLRPQRMAPVHVPVRISVDPRKISRYVPPHHR